MSNTEVLVLKSTASTRKLVPGYTFEPPQPLISHVADAVHAYVSDLFVEALGSLPSKDRKRFDVVSDTLAGYGQPTSTTVDDSGKIQLTWLIPVHRSTAALNGMLRKATAAGFKDAFLDFSFSLHKHVLVFRG